MDGFWIAMGAALVALIYVLFMWAIDPYVSKRVKLHEWWANRPTKEDPGRWDRFLETRKREWEKS